MVHLADPDVSLKVAITGYSPFIPLDDKTLHSPVLFWNIPSVTRPGVLVDFQFSYHLSHLAQDLALPERDLSRNAVIPGAGAFLFNLEERSSEAFGSAALGRHRAHPPNQGMWFRGGWFDSTSVLCVNWKPGSLPPMMV